MTRLAAVFVLLLCLPAVAATAQKKPTMAEALAAGDTIVPAAILEFWQALTLEEKAAQTLMVYMPSGEYVAKHKFGGVLIMKSHFADTAKLRRDLEVANAGLKIPLLVATDQEGGKVNRLKGADPKWAHLPSAKKMRRLPEDSVFALAKEVGAALASYGINMNLAPVLDPPKDHRNKPSFMETSDRSFGPAEEAAPILRAFAKGMKASGVLSTSKHFPGYDSWTNSDHQIAVSAAPKDRVKQNAKLFGELSDDIPVIMMSSVRFLRYSNKPAVFDTRITGLARQVAPNAILLTDDLWGASLRAWISGKERVQSKGYPTADFRKLIRTIIWAGNDMFMTTYPAKAVEMIQYMVLIGEKSPEYRQKIEMAAARILRLKYTNGIWKGGAKSEGSEGESGDSAAESEAEGGTANGTAPTAKASTAGSQDSAAQAKKVAEASGAEGGTANGAAPTAKAGTAESQDSAAQAKKTAAASGAEGGTANGTAPTAKAGTAGAQDSAAQAKKTAAASEAESGTANGAAPTAKASTAGSQDSAKAGE